MSQPKSGTDGATLVVIKGSKTRLVGGQLYNGNTLVSYCQIFDAATTAAVTLGSTPPALSFGIPPNGSTDLGAAMQLGYEFVNGIVLAMTTTRSGSTAPANTVDYNLAIE